MSRLDEEKLTVDNCLCDACFRHVDRRANCPSYKKRLSSSATSAATTNTTTTITTSDYHNNSTNDSVKDDDTSILSKTTEVKSSEPHHSGRIVKCQVVDCTETSSHSIRRKWFVKMRKQITKILNLNADAGHGSGILSICVLHYNVISHLMICTLCKRKLMRNHIYYITQVRIPSKNSLLFY